MHDIITHSLHDSLQISDLIGGGVKRLRMKGKRSARRKRRYCALHYCREPVEKRLRALESHGASFRQAQDRKITRLNFSHPNISYDALIVKYKMRLCEYG